MKEKVFETRCGNIHYWVSDKYDDGKRNLVFLPGLSADHRLFDKQIEFFEGKINVLVWDAPAHAASRPFTYDFELTDKAKWLNRILEREKFESPVLIGQSMGGYVGQVYCEVFPEGLSGFISIDSAPIQRKYMKKWEIACLKHTEFMYLMYPWKALLRDGSRGVATTEYGSELMRAMMRDYKHSAYAKLVGKGYRMLANAVETDKAYVIKCPALLICGDSDKAGLTMKYNKAWHEETGMKLEWIPNAGHNSNTDAPEYVNGLILKFIEELDNEQ